MVLGWPRGRPRVLPLRQPSQVNLLSPSPFWPIRDGLPADYPSLDTDVRCDAVVLGGGVSGALAALHLAEAGVDTVVVDRGDVGHGSTAGSTSLLQYEIDEPLHRLARLHGLDAAERCYRRCRDAVDGIERLVKRLRLACDFERKQSLLLASSRAHLPGLRLEFAARTAAGFKVSWWDQARLGRESALEHAGAILSRDAAQLDAYAFTHGVLAAAAKAGARVFDRTRVTRKKIHGRGVELRTPGGACVRARHLVIATGYEADALLPVATTQLRSTYALVTEPVANFEGWPAARCLIWETADPYVYLRTTGDRRIIIGGYDEDFQDPRRRDRLLPRKTAMLKRRLRQLFPAIPFDVAYSWAGTFARTPDGLPYIGRHPGIPRTWLALGYGGNGITFSLIAAEVIRDQMLGRPNSDAALFGFGRLKAPKS
jgi:glycine/D-amino acid oxidase-like deaminating enzyme